MEYNFISGRKLRVGTMYCLAKNYKSHALELGNTIPSEPSVFLKPPSAYVPSGGTVVLPSFSKIVHHELELVVIIGQECHNVDRKRAIDYIAGYAVGLDITARDIQQKAITEGNPWGVCKGFFSSAPISQVVEIEALTGEIPYFDLELYVNGELRQMDNTENLVRPVDELIEYLSHVFLLEAGDCIFTGTPKGVGKIFKGDELKAKLVDFVELKVRVD